MPNHPTYIEFYLLWYFMMGINNFITHRDKGTQANLFFKCMKIITLSFNFVCISNIFLLMDYAKWNIKKAVTYSLRFLFFFFNFNPTYVCC